MPALSLPTLFPRAPDPAHAPPAAHGAARLAPVPGPRRAIVGVIVAVHGLALWGLLQLQDVRRAVVERAPILVHLIDAPAPARPLPPPAPLPPTLAPPPLQPVLMAAPLIAVAPAPSPLTVATPPPAPEVSELAAAPAPVAAPAPAVPIAVVLPAPAPAPPAPPPVPRTIPSSAVQYLDPPAPVYPRLSIRLNETGVVLVRVLIGEDGLPRQVQLARSSGFPRLDEAAVASVQKARFRPPTENGQPISGWARIEIPFELEK